MDASNITRAVRTAYNNARNKCIPQDTGTLYKSIQIKTVNYGYDVSFNLSYVNPKTRQSVREYIDAIEKYHKGWWKTFQDTFISELSLLLHANVQGGNL